MCIYTCMHAIGQDSLFFYAPCPCPCPLVHACLCRAFVLGCEGRGQRGRGRSEMDNAILHPASACHCSDSSVLPSLLSPPSILPASQHSSSKDVYTHGCLCCSRLIHSSEIPQCRQRLHTQDSTYRTEHTPHSLCLHPCSKHDLSIGWFVQCQCFCRWILSEGGLREGRQEEEQDGGDQ